MTDEVKLEVEAPQPTTPLAGIPEAAPWSIAAWTRGIMFQYFGALLMEPNGGGRYVISIGRVALLAVLAQAMYQWHTIGQDIVGGMKETLFALLTYNFGTKGAALMKEAIDAWKAAKTPPGTP